jgi:hypothetical protein
MVILVAAIALGALVLFKALGGAIPLTENGVIRIAQAIAVAEGFYVAGSRPQRNHNPGDMTQDLIGKKVGTDGPFVVYGTDDDGWSNLYKQVEMWLGGSSSHANASSTISDLSTFYTTTDQASWATNVANYLGVSIDTSIGSIS